MLTCNRDGHQHLPATCFGCASGQRVPEAACDLCCGHTQHEGSWCIPIDDLPEYAATLAINSDEIATERNRLRNLLRDISCALGVEDEDDDAIKAKAWGLSGRLHKYVGAVSDGVVTVARTSHNVLAARIAELERHARADQLRMEALTGMVRRVEQLLSDIGCECDCECRTAHDDVHDPDCEDRCVPCRVEAALKEEP